MESPENMSSKITFKNQPKLSGHEADQKYDERRQALIPEIENFVSTDEFFRDREASIEFSHKGASSLVSFIEADNEKFVLKVPLSSSGFESEGQFLKAWEKVGVRVPHVFKEGKLGVRSYLLMEYIDAPTLIDAEAQGLVKRDTAHEQGKILRQMHAAKAEGYGRSIDGKPEFDSFEKWLESDIIRKRIGEVQENGVLGDEHGPIADALDKLIEYTKNNPESVYCHFDFGASNILATEPLTVIDPHPLFNHGVIDIGRSMLLSASGGNSKSSEKMKEAYYEGEDVDVSALQASIIFSAYWKTAYWHKVGKTKSIENVRNYLAETRGLL
jgi:fructosamine-3-kinase